MPKYIGKTWIDVLSQNIEETRRVILVWSPEFFSSEWTSFESKILQSQDPNGKKDRLLLFLIHTPCDLPRRFAALQGLPFSVADGESRTAEGGSIEFEFRYQQLLYNLDLSRPFEADFEQFKNHYQTRRLRDNQSRVNDAGSPPLSPGGHTAAARELVRLEQWDEAHRQVANALHQYPADADLLSLLQLIKERLRAQEIERRAQAIREIRELIEQQNFSQAQERLAGALQFFPHDPELRAVQHQISELSVERARRNSRRPLDWRTQVPSDVLIDNVHFTITAPAALQRGAACEIQFWAHVEQQRQVVLERALQAYGSDEVDMSIKSEGPFPLERGACISVRLRIDGLKCVESHKWMIWTGDIGSANFVVIVPSEAPEGNCVGSASIRLNGCQIAKMSFVLRIGSKKLASDAIPTETVMHRSGFASYASVDRGEVLARVQGMEVAHKGLKVFVDIVDLRSAQYWESELVKRIDDADVFYLFWCRHAIASEWVDREWQWALQSKGLDFIDPVPLEVPEYAPPPRELASKHFSDPLLAFIGASAKGTHHT